MGAPEVGLWAWVTYLRNRLAASRNEDGYTTQTVIITAVMAALATAALHQLAGPLLRDSAVETATTAERVTVTVTGRAQAIVPGLSVSVRGSAAQPKERFAP